MIALASDHAGLELKAAVKEYLAAKGLPYQDFGTYTSDSCNYAEYALKAANAVSSGECEKGILICGTGIGIGIAANKVKGIRCVSCSEPYSARLSRQHNDSNMLSLGARVVGQGLALTIIEEWLLADFEGGRHATRISQITQIEESGQLTING